MTAPDTALLVLAVLLQAPFAFRLGFVVRDGREWLLGGLFLAVGSGIAALAAGLSGSLLVGTGAALAAVFVLAHSRFVAAHRTPFPPSPPPPPATPSGSPPPVAIPAPDPPPIGSSPGWLLSAMCWRPDRIGELRHRKRLRKLERQQAERQAGGRLAAEVRRPPMRLRVRPRRDFQQLPPPE